MRDDAPLVLEDCRDPSRPPLQASAGLEWLYAHDPYAQLLTRADYRARFGVLLAGGERQPLRAEPKVPVPYLFAGGLDGRLRAFRLVCRCSCCRVKARQRLLTRAGG
jgi:hypothetical protein